MESDLKIEGQPKGTRTLVGLQATEFIGHVSPLFMEAPGYPVIFSALDSAEFYEGKPGERMTVGGPTQPTVLVPEITSQAMRLMRRNQGVKEYADIPMHYLARCYRLENSQYGRWREFWQFGVEYPARLCTDPAALIQSAVTLCEIVCPKAKDRLRVKTGVERGLDYYEKGRTFELALDELKTARQVCGGGYYEGGCGFAIGVDRLLLAREVLG